MRFWHTNDRFFSVVSVLGLIFYQQNGVGGGGVTQVQDIN